MGMIRDSLTTEAYDREYSNQTLIGRIGLYFRPWWRRLLGITAMVTLLALIDALVPILVARGVGLMAQTKQANTQVMVLLVSAVLGMRVFYWGGELGAALVDGDVHRRCDAGNAQSGLPSRDEP